MKRVLITATLAILAASSAPTPADYGDGRNFYQEALNLLRAKNLADRIDPAKVRKAGTRQRGLVVDISKR